MVFYISGLGDSRMIKVERTTISKKVREKMT
jgi:hypothetical protein